MDHKQFVAQIPPDTRTRLLMRSDRAGLRHLALHCGLIAVCSGLILARIPFWWLLLPVQGILLIFNFTLLHECTHQTPFHSRWLNEIVGWFTGFLVGLPFLWFRYFHLAHHKYTNDPARDPELVGGGKPETWQAYVWHISGLPVWASQARTLMANIFGGDIEFAPRSARTKIKVESVIIVFLYSVTASYIVFGSTMPIKLWILPLLLGQPILRLYLLAEHGRCPMVANMLENSRTTFTNRFVRFVAWNMPYHAEHHSYPNVPFHQLPTLHEYAKPHLKTTSDGYVAFHREYISPTGV